ncbi:hypothetical protein [Catelliglobosispora koreensis]|uniref:hypothetical protein n=1 Tax=Catelliglobosispora koreensis TaxID=129052 RepID=UPI000366218E
MSFLARLPYDTIFSTVYFGLRLNLCLAAACSPLLLALAMSQDPLAAWPFFVALASLCAPATAAGFATFTGSSFWAAYRRRFWRSMAVGGAASTFAVVLGIEVTFAARTRFAVVVPMLLVLAALIPVVSAQLLAANESRLLAAAYQCVRRWYLSLANLAVLLMVAAAVTVKPAVGLFLLPAPALYLVWANARHMASTTG